MYLSQKVYKCKVYIDRQSQLYSKENGGVNPHCLFVKQPSIFDSCIATGRES